MKYSPLIFLLTSTVAWSEISSLSQEELTDTYIKDTTVIVRPQKEQPAVSEDVRISLKVSPLEEATQLTPQDNTQILSAINPALNSYTELNEQAALRANLAPQTPLPTTQFLLPPASEDALALIRQEYNGAYGIEAGTPIDLTSLGFLPTLPQEQSFKNGLPAGTALSADDRSFTLRIPNLGNFNSQSFATPNGEVGVNVTPAHIEYTVNLPR